jgi:hypothetical protein
MVNVWLDSQGNLDYFLAIPPHRDKVEETPGEPDWVPLFTAAGLELDDFTPSPPEWLPEAYCEERRAWTGTFPDQAEPPLRVEACSYGGRPVAFQVVYPWTRPWRMEPWQPPVGQKVRGIVWSVINPLVLLCGLLLARRHLRLGRGDRKGALRLAFLIFGAHMVAWILRAHHVPDLGDEWWKLTQAIGTALYYAILFWVIYIALEPFVRRQWPAALVSWSRLLSGRFRDPLVGRHLLYGAVFGAVMGAVDIAEGPLPGWFGGTPEIPYGMDADGLLGARALLGDVFASLPDHLMDPMFVLFLFFLFRIVFRRMWLALPAGVALFVSMGALNADHPVIAITVGIVFFTVGLLCLARFGLVFALTAHAFGILHTDFPLTLDFSAWYGGAGLAGLLLAVAVTVYAFVVSLGSRRVFRERAFEP